MRSFESFFMGGYECADHINRSGNRINLLKETQHDLRAADDFRMLAATGIRTAREGICWSAVETTPYHYDFSEIKSRLDAAALSGIQIIWDLCHFGYPDGLFPTHPHFVSRYVSYCEAFATFHSANTNATLFAVPVNEISFLSWHSGDMRGTVPFAINSGGDIKYHLCKAAIQGINALRMIAPNCRIVLVEPLIKIHEGYEMLTPEFLFHLNEPQFEAMDILAGYMYPELGGREENLDILGFNYYWDNQWVHNEGTLPWPEFEPRRTPLSEILDYVYKRYKRPIFLSETGHFGEGRVPWLEEITGECVKAIFKGINIIGLCIYPVIDRPDWDDLTRFFNCGIWDLDQDMNRIPFMPYINSLASCQNRIQQALELRAGL